MTMLNEKGLAIANGTIRVYNSNPDTSEYTCAEDEALSVGVGLPAHSYLDEPPKSKVGYAICRGAEGWEYRVDHRGKTAYSTETRDPEVISGIGELPDGFTFIAPTSNYDVWTKKKWVKDEAAELADIVAGNEAKKKELLADARDQISILDYAVEIDEATDEEIARLKLLKSYRLALNRIDTSEREINWPEMP